MTIYFMSKCVCGGDPKLIKKRRSNGKDEDSYMRFECTNCGLTTEESFDWGNGRDKAQVKWADAIAKCKHGLDEYRRSSNETLQGEL